MPTRHLVPVNPLPQPRQRPVRQAFELAKKSIAIEDNALAHRTLARQHFSLFGFWVSTTRKFDLAVTELEAAKRLQPGDPDVLADLALVLSFAGRPDEALKLVRKAIERNPNHPSWYFAAVGIAYLLTEKPELAIRDLKRWSESTPSWDVPYMFLASANGLAGKVEAAAAALERRDQLASGKMSFYAVSRTWPMAPKQEAIFVKGLKLAGMTGEN